MATVSANGLYQQASQTIIVTINKSTLTAKAENKTRAYAANNPPTTVVYTGFVQNDTETELNSKPVASIATTATNTAPAGSTHEISLTGGADDNYEILNENGTLTITQANQTISFQPLSNKLVSDDPFNITATSSSGLPVSFNVVSGPASLTGTTVTLTGSVGTVTILATQSGDNNYTAASPVEQSFEVADVVLSAESRAEVQLKIYPNPANKSVTIENNDQIYVKIKVIDNTGRIIKILEINRGLTELDIHTLPPGLYTIQAESSKGQQVYRILVKK
jgi:hypothetical protein